MTTQKETLRLLCRSLINRLENRKSISFPARLRQIIQEEIYNLVGPFILTDEHLKEKILAKIGAKAEMLEDHSFTNGEQFKAAKAVVKNLFAQNEFNGFYFQKSPKQVAGALANYFMRSSHIEDVYETDEVLEQQIVDIIRDFKASEAH